MLNEEGPLIYRCNILW